MSDELKAGDKVRLKSGGPVMTAGWVEDQYGVISAFCEWFDEKRIAHDRVFPVTSLERVD